MLWKPLFVFIRNKKKPSADWASTYPISIIFQRPWSTSNSNTTKIREYCYYIFTNKNWFLSNCLGVIHFRVWFWYILRQLFDVCIDIKSRFNTVSITKIKPPSENIPEFAPVLFDRYFRTLYKTLIYRQLMCLCPIFI